MSFVFRSSDRSVQAGVRRIARAELAGALRRLDGAFPDAAAVHGLRKHTKKLRGLIRLVRPVMPGFYPVNAMLRDGAARLAPLRDAEVRLDTLRALAPDMPGGLPEGIEARLVAEVSGLRACADVAAELGRLRQDLAALERDAREWRLSERGWAALAPGLGATWRAARRGLRRSREALGRDASPFHDWRKAVKHHWYQARLLRPLWPAHLGPWVVLVDALGEGLGRHNDLDVLRAHLRALDDPALAEAAREGPLAQALERRMRLEAEAALALGTRLLAERPGAMVRRWGVWWQVWEAGR
jgi:CHAD domain-containing protein